MRMMLAVFTLLVFAVLAGVMLTGVQVAEARTVTIAVLRDGETPQDDLLSRIERELGQQVASGVDVVFKSDPAFDAGWDAARMTTVIENALRDREVDMILGLGALVTQAAARPDLELTKPFVSALVQREDLFEIPHEGDGSLKKNLSFILAPQALNSDIEAFRELVPITTLHVVVGKTMAEQLDIIRERLGEYEEKLGVTIVPVPISDDIEGSVASLGDEVEGVYLTATPHLSSEQRQSLIDRLNSRGYPTFSAVGHADVELGAMAAISPDLTEQVVRRVAQNLNQIIRGVSPSELPVILRVESHLLFNARTVKAIGYSPRPAILIYAEFLYPEALQGEAEALNLSQALEAAEAGNTALAIKDADIEVVLRDKQRARSVLLPQIMANGGYENNQRLFPEGLLPDEITSAGVFVSQMLYDDRAVSNFRSSGRIHDSATLDREIERLNVLADAGVTYLRMVLARVLNRIQMNNVRLTEDNLALSKVRFDVGYSGRDEVYRWEAELAQRRANLLTSHADVESERIAFNQVLGIEQNRRWAPEEIEVDPEVFPFLDGRINSIVKNVSAGRDLKEFFVALALQNAPELQFFDKTIEAQNIQIGQRKRAFVIPSFEARFIYNHNFKMSPEIMDIRKDLYQFEVAAVYPLFVGGDKYYDLKGQEAALKGIENEKELTRQLIEQRVRTTLARLESSFPGIRLSAVAADNAGKNLEVVQDKYAQGIVNVIDLLDAQNQSFTSDQAMAAAVYEFLIDLVAFQRAISWFEDDKSAEERDELVNQISTAVGAN